ncbi:MAG: LCP family protein [Firmicutes bacterium]|nr:LCP family protein [Bacillota bacterium]
MPDNHDDNLYTDEADEDLLTTIRRWTEKAQQENEAKRTPWPPQEPAGQGSPAHMRNPWAPELTAAADRALQEEPQAGVPAPSPVYAKNELRKEKAFRKKKRPLRRVLATLLALLVLLGAGGYALAYAMAGKVDRETYPVTDEDRAALFAASGTTRVTNILLLGLDRVDAGFHTDTMLLLSVDRVHRTLKLTSFLRDSWLKLPNGKYGKLNTAVHQKGGPVAVMRAITKNFNVRVDHYVMVNFDVFEQIVDALGGVSVAITDKEINFLCKNTRLGQQIGKEKMQQDMEKKGTVKLTGEQALIFCRIRKLDSDFQRTARQQRFLESLISACKKNPLRLLGLMGDTLTKVQTDMSRAQMANLAAMAPLLLGYGMEEFTVPAEGTWSYATKRGASAITLKEEQNAEKLRKFIYE